MIGIAAHQRRQIEGHAQAGRPCRQQLAVAVIGVFRHPEPGKLPHRPELALIAGWMNAARIGDTFRDRPARCRGRTVECCRGCRGVRSAGPRSSGMESCVRRTSQCPGEFCLTRALNLPTTHHRFSHMLGTSRPLPSPPRALPSAFAPAALWRDSSGSGLAAFSHAHIGMERWIDFTRI